MSRNEPVKASLYALYAFLWLGGVFTYLTRGAPPSQMAFAGPLFLVVGSVLLLAQAQNLSGFFRRRYVFGVVFAGLAGYLAEVLGVRTGFPFGGYHYTDAFRPLLFDVPLVMACAWILLAMSALGYARILVRKPVLTIVTAAMMLTFIDLVLDPAAVEVLGLWIWHHPGNYFGIPWSNYAGWFLTGLIVSTVLQVMLRDISIAPLARGLGLSQVLFFGIINVAGRLWFPAALGFCIVFGAVTAEFFVSRQSSAANLSPHR